MDEFYGRNMPDRRWLEDEYVDAAQLYASLARIFDETGHEFFRRENVSWSELELVQATARRPGARAFYLLDRKSARAAVRGRAVSEMVSRAGTAAIAPAELPFHPPPGTTIAVRVVASITHTLGGLKVDKAANVLRADKQPVPGLYAAGVDAGGIATGGYASGLAQALVLGLTAAETAARDG
jgi:predicted oxidoreductase